MVRFTVLASGSKGNSTVVTGGKTRILVDAGLSRHDFIAGAAFTLCDICWGVHAHRWFGMDYLGLTRPELPALRAWYNRLCQRHAYQASVVATPIV